MDNSFGGFGGSFNSAMSQPTRSGYQNGQSGGYGNYGRAGGYSGQGGGPQQQNSGGQQGMQTQPALFGQPNFGVPMQQQQAAPRQTDGGYGGYSPTQGGWNSGVVAQQQQPKWQSQMKFGGPAPAPAPQQAQPMQAQPYSMPQQAQYPSQQAPSYQSHAANLLDWQNAMAQRYQQQLQQLQSQAPAAQGNWSNALNQKYLQQTYQSSPQAMLSPYGRTVS